MSKRIAIVGGGYIGFRLAKALENEAEITLIEQRSHFVHTAAMIRAIVDPSILELALIPYDKLLQRGTWVQARAAAVDGSGVVLEDGHRIDAEAQPVGGVPRLTDDRRGELGARGFTRTVLQHLLSLPFVGVPHARHDEAPS